jgi:hypothetical protein
MGPSCDVVLDVVDDATLETIDSKLADVAETITRTRGGRKWQIWIRGRPVIVSIEGTSSSVSLSAGCNALEDYEILRQLSAQLALELGGLASEPIK